ncbi:N-acetylmuramoyl-L-alanine amidase [Achromobacter aloeverae]|nr:N-acetylmuramoyl-L-alanine amidase [Achromobacter aloeverae]
MMKDDAPNRAGSGRRAALSLLGALSLAGCARRWPAGLDVDTSISAVSQDSRVRFIVLHYTDGSEAASLRTLSRGDVSAHYLVSDEDTGAGRVRVYNLVPEARNAWHAGDSSWFGRTALNNASIGIEITNGGPIPGSGSLAPPRSATGQTTGGQPSLEQPSVSRSPPRESPFRQPSPGQPAGQPPSMEQPPAWQPPIWQPYTEAQIRAVILLVRDIAQRHGVRPENIVGHSDIAPQRKTDPGPLFPWRRLAQAGLGRWYDEAAAQAATRRYAIDGALPDASWFQDELARVGYDVPRTGAYDAATTRVIAAFQMHYRPARYDGVADAETAAILSVLPGETE